MSQRADLIARVVTLAGMSSSKLFAAAFEDDPNAVREHADAIGESDDKGWTALHWAAHAGAVGAAAVLIELGADPNVLDRFGKPPLFRAVFQRKADVARLLRQHGADPLLAGVAHFAREAERIAEVFDDLPDPLPDPIETEPVAVLTDGKIPDGPPNAPWQSEHGRLWKLLVPSSDEAPTIQGEVIRASGRLADEAYRNGNINWGKMHEGFVRFLAQTLDDPATFDPTERAAIAEVLAAIVHDADEPDVSGAGSTYYRVSEFGVRWCLANRSLRPLTRSR